MLLSRYQFTDLMLCRRLSVSAVMPAALLLSGCASTGFQSSVGEFGKLTSVASTQQAASLTRISQDELERIRAERAASHVDLRLSRDCAALLGEISSGLSSDRKAAPCTLVRSDGVVLEEPPQFANIIALSRSLNGYAESLIELASDRTDDNKAFTSSITGLATSLGGLDAAVHKVTGADPSDNSKKLGAIAGLVDEAGQLYFAHRRAAALKKIIIAADPFVQEASALLSGADARIGLYDRAGLAKDLMAAQSKQSVMASTASPEALRAAQDKIYDLLAAFTQRGEGAERFVAIATAHGLLAKAARSDATAEELRQAILGLIQLAGTVDKTASVFEEKAEGGINGN